MKKTIYAEGGRPFYDDDLEIIQNEAQVAALSLYESLGSNFIVSGCRVAATGATYTVGAGLVYVGGELLRFLGATGISLPAALVAGEVSVLDEREYETGGTRTCIQEQFAVVQAGNGAVPLYAAGGLTLQHLLASQARTPGEVQMLANLTPVLYDGTGKGMPGTAAWGWGLCNGQGGRADLRQRFIAGYDPDANEYAAVGKTGGEKEVALTGDQMPVHTHKFGVYKAVAKQGDNGTSRTTLDTGYKEGFTSESAGGNQAHENRPPFYVLAFRQWIGI